MQVQASASMPVPLRTTSSRATRTITWTADMAQPDGRHLRLIATSTFNGNTRIYRSSALTRAGEVPLVEIVFTRR